MSCCQVVTGKGALTVVTPLPMHTPSTTALGISHQPQLLLRTCSVATVQLLQAVSRQPTLVPSLRLTSEVCTLGLSPQLHQHVSILGSAGWQCLCSHYCCALHKHCALLLASEAPSRLISVLARDCPGCGKLASTTPPWVQASALFPFPFCPAQLRGGFLTL